MSGFIKFHCSISRIKKRSQSRDATTLARTNTILFVCTGRLSLHKGSNSEHVRNRISRYVFVKNIGGGTVDNGPLAPLSTGWGSERVGPGISRSAIPRLLFRLLWGLLWGLLWLLLLSVVCGCPRAVPNLTTVAKAREETVDLCVMLRGVGIVRAVPSSIWPDEDASCRLVAGWPLANWIIRVGAAYGVSGAAVSPVVKATAVISRTR